MKKQFKFAFKGKRTKRQAEIERGESQPDEIDLAAGEIRKAIEDIFEAVNRPRRKRA